MRKQVFVLEVQDIRNHSWQGSLEWVNGHKRETFRSMLELLRLIDSATGKSREGTQNGQDGDGEARGTA